METLEESLSSRRSWIFAICVTIFVAVATVCAIPFAQVKLSTNAAPFIIFLTLAWSADFVTAFLFMTQARARRSKPLLILASGYTFSSLMILMHALTFPGIFAAHGLLGAVTATPVWFWVWWHVGFPIFVMAYAIGQKRNEKRARVRIASLRTVLFGAAAVGVGAVVLSVETLKEIRSLPRITRMDPSGLHLTNGLGPLVIVCILAALLSLVCLTRLRRETDLWLAVALCASFFDVALTTLFGAGRFSIGWYVGRAESLVASTVVMLSFLGTVDLVLARLATLSRIDGLTGLVNRRAFDEDLETAIAVAARANKSLSLLMIDVDYFKGYNERYGHQGGDEALRDVAKCLRRALTRRSDIVARYGGEEFAVVLPVTSMAGAMQVAERVRSAVNARDLTYEGSAPGVITISIGVSSFSGERLRAQNAAERLIAAADLALYRAKAAGRNSVKSAVGEAPEAKALALSS